MIRDYELGWKGLKVNAGEAEQVLICLDTQRVNVVNDENE